MTKPGNNRQKTMPLTVVGSSTFGRYPKISKEKTTNMIMSDNFLVPSSGYKKQINISDSLVGRGLFNSTRWGKMIVVVSDNVYAVSTNLSYVKIGTLNTTEGDVFITENNDNQICLCDKVYLYFYDFTALTFTVGSLDFQAGYIEYQDSRFISPNVSTSNNAATWRISEVTDNTSFPNDQNHVGAIQTKGDYAVACVAVPGRSQLLLVFGNIVGELWYDVGNGIFPYQRATSVNIDYGVANPATIACLEKIVVWLAINEKSGPAILYTTGGDITQISTDGINFLLAHLNNPRNSYGFFFKQDGHLLYQLTFPSPSDNLTIVYDFTTQKFFDLTDESGNCHIAKRVVFFNNKYYFISFFDGNVYEMSSLFYTYDYGDMVFDIPRSRICNSIRLPDESTFTIPALYFTTEQGTDPNNVEQDGSDYFPRIDLSLSKDGGYTFGSTISKSMYYEGHRKNRLMFRNLGRANDLTTQLQFWSKWRFVATNGGVDILL